MKKFALVIFGSSEEEKKAWESAGFVIINGHPPAGGEQCPDVIFWHQTDQDSIVWELVRKTVPKVLLIAGRQGVVFPGNLSRIYQQQVIEGRGVWFTLGSKLQGMVKVPGGDAFNGFSTTAEQVRVLAGTVYRHLLEDTIRENEEWCGHMSSVVGPM